jgi:hypothetical protein
VCIFCADESYSRNFQVKYWEQSGKTKCLENRLPFNRLPQQKFDRRVFVIINRNADFDIFTSCVKKNIMAIKWDKTETKITERKVDGEEDSDDAVGANGGDGGGSVGGGGDDDVNDDSPKR